MWGAGPFSYEKIVQPVLDARCVRCHDAADKKQVNLTGVLLLSQAVIPHMKSKGKGSIACMSSVSAQRGGGIFGGPHYSAAKAGVLGLAKAMAREFVNDGIVKAPVPLSFFALDRRPLDVYLDRVKPERAHHRA